ncbi:MAG: hypothetical protein ACOZNI_19910 [Myxococcota bacterium]
MSDVIADFCLSELAGNGFVPLPEYARALREAFRRSPAVYGRAAFGIEFRRVARDGAWFAGLLASDAHLEGYSAKQLWAWSNSIPEQEFAAQVRVHAEDEARHSRMFGQLLLSLYPESDTPELRARLGEMAPTFPSGEAPSPTIDMRTDEEVLSSAIQINLYEIKALVLGHLLSPVVRAYSNGENSRRNDAITRAILRDELRHIAYSAHFIEQAIARGNQDYVWCALAEFQEMLNTSTGLELEALSCKDTHHPEVNAAAIAAAIAPQD